MVRLLKDRGLVSYEHFPIEASLMGEQTVPGISAFDAVSIYTFESKAKAEERHGIAEVLSDSAACMDVDSLVVFQTDRRSVFARRK
jgi:hypothetical protein